MSQKNKEDIISEQNNNLQILTKANIKLGLASVDKDTAIRMAGQILLDGGYVVEDYIDAMIQRDNEFSTYLGNGIAIPHGVNEAKERIKKTGISILQFPDGVDFGPGIAYLIFGIAGVGDEHLMTLAKLADVFEDEAKIDALIKTNDVNFIYKQFIG